MSWLYLLAGSCAGGAARYVLSGLVYQAAGTRFPYGTLIVNITGCFLIGFLAVLSEEKFLLNPNSRLLLMTGFCGAYTTFSTWMLETSNLLRDGQPGYAVLNILLSIALGFLLFKAGMWTAELL